MTSPLRPRHDGDTTSARLRRTIPALQFIASIILLVWLLRDKPLREWGTLLVNVQWPSVVLLLLLNWLQVGASGLRWGLIGKSLQLNGGLRDYQQLTFGGFAVGQLLPSNLFGEVLRFSGLHKHNNWRPLGKSLVIDRIYVQLSWAVLLPLSLMALSRLITPTVALTLTAVTITATYQVLKRMRRTWLKRFWGSLSPAVTLQGLLLSVAVALLVPLQLLVAADAMGLTLDPIALLTVTPGFLAMLAVPISFGGWGIREWAVLILLGPHASSEAQLLSASILMGAASLLAALMYVPWLIRSVLQRRHDVSATRGL